MSFKSFQHFSCLTVVTASIVSSVMLASSVPAWAKGRSPRTSFRTVITAVKRCSAQMPRRQQHRMAKAIYRASRRHGYDPLLIQAIAEIESSCRPTVRSHAGAIGLLQLKPTTARMVAKEANIHWTGAAMLKDPVRNIQLGVRYLAKLEHRFQDQRLALAAYNLGPTRVARMQRPYAQKYRYVQKVLTRYQSLQESYS